MTEQLIPVNMSQLLGAPESNPEPQSALEKTLLAVTPEDAAAVSQTDVVFKFRSMLDKNQLKALKASAPAVSEKMINDYNAIIGFGAPVLAKMNAASVEMLEAQRDIKIPDAEVIVNDLLRNLDGYANKYRNKELEGFAANVAKFFRGTGYSLKTMVRDAQPIIEKMDMAEKKTRSIELELADNVTRGQKLYRNRTATLTEVVAVLAALEEIIEVARARFAVIDAKLVEADNLPASDDGVQAVKLDGKTISVNELRNMHTDYANGVSQLELSWFDWRQQFFVGFAQAPTSRNIILVSATMQRRLQVFRTMGIPSGRDALASWQQAALAKKGADAGNALQEGTNRLIQASAKATGEAVTETAMAAQAPVIADKTIIAIIDGIKAQCDGIVAADKWGRQQRERSIAAMEAGEIAIRTTFDESRRQLVQNAISGVQSAPELAPVDEADILTQLGVSK